MQRSHPIHHVTFDDRTWHKAIEINQHDDDGPGSHIPRLRPRIMVDIAYHTGDHVYRKTVTKSWLDFTDLRYKLTHNNN